jgi:hypothetical protein
MSATFSGRIQPLIQFLCYERFCEKIRIVYDFK